MPAQTATERFVQHLANSQTWLYAYILILLGDPAAASDVLQEANLVLWRKADEYVDGTDFNAWARSVARFQVLAFRRDASRDRHVFDESLVNALADPAAESVAALDARRGALHFCLEKLGRRQRDLLHARYTEGNSIEAIAQGTGRTAGGVGMALSRIRQSLFDCIRGRLSEGGA
jgi:RNA polymerase sigma-70 factor, ECF subfamily